MFYGLKDERLCSCLELKFKNSFEVNVKGLNVKAFPTSHDSRAAVGYRLTFTEDDKEYSIGYATDTGYVTDEMHSGLEGCFAAVIEANHDSDMLKNGPYPVELKQRIASKTGHLSNSDSAALASFLCDSGTKHILLAHLSEENNTPTLAYNEVKSAIGKNDVNIRVAAQDSAVWLLGEDE